MRKRDNKGHLLLEFSTEDNFCIENTSMVIIKSNTQYQEKYFVDGIGYFVITNYKNRNFCHIDVYLLFEELEFLALKHFLNKVITDLRENLNIIRSKNELILLKFFVGEYSRLELNNDSIKGIIYEHGEVKKNIKEVKMHAISYSIGVDTVKNSQSDIINLGFWLANTIRNIIEETKGQNLSTNEFALYFYNFIVSKLDFVAEYYNDIISNMKSDEFSREIYYSSFVEKEKKKKKNTVAAEGIIDDELF